jgi:hypothetical protein
MASVTTEYGTPQLIFGDCMPLGHEFFAAQDSKSKNEHIRALRLASRALLASQVKDDVLTVQDINTLFEASAPSDIQSSLDHKHIINWLTAADETALWEFSSWNVERYAEQQLALDRSKDELDESRRARVQRLIDMSLFPKIAAELFEESVQRSDGVYAMDDFEAGGTDADGRCLLYTRPKILIANLFVDRPTFSGIGQEMRDTKFHEEMHAMGAATGRGFMSIVADNYPGSIGIGQWAEEMTVSHCVQVAGNILDPMPEQLMPSERHDDSEGSNPDLRQLGATIMVYGSCDIPVELITDAYFEPLDQRRNPARRALRKRLNQNFSEILNLSNGAPYYKFTRQYENVGPFEKAHMAFQTQSALDRAIQRKQSVQRSAPVL